MQTAPFASTLSRATVFLLFILTLQPPALGAQEPPSVEVTDEGVLLDFQGTDLSVVVSMLAELAGITVSYSGLPSRPVTLRSARPVPRQELRAMLESVARSNGLTLVEEGGILRVSSADMDVGPPTFGGPAGGDPTDDGVRLYMYPLRHTQAGPLAQALRELFDLGDRRTSTGAPAGRAPLSRELQRNRLPLPLGGDSQAPNSTPEPQPGSPTGPGLSAHVRGAVQIVPYELNNSIMIRASPQDYETIRAAIERLDSRPLQVLIEALIVEVRRDRQFDLGIDATIPDQREPKTGVILGGELKGASAGDVVLRVLSVGAVQADVVIRALAASSDVTILSRPVVLAQNNREARILVGAQQPFVQIFRSLPTDAAVRDQVVQYRDVGTQLTITPTINPDGYVTLAVLQEVSNATAEVQFGAPVISTREAETQLFVKDGHTAVIGGLVDAQRTTGSSGIPLLKDLPLLGHLFRSTHRRRTTTELFILLTPHVIYTDHDLDAATRELHEGADLLRKRLRSPEPLIDRAGPVEHHRN